MATDGKLMVADAKLMVDAFNNDWSMVDKWLMLPKNGQLMVNEWFIDGFPWLMMPKNLYG